MHFPERRVQFQGSLRRRDRARLVPPLHQRPRQSGVIGTVPGVQIEKAIQVPLGGSQLKLVVVHRRQVLDGGLVTRIQLQRAQPPPFRLLRLVLDLTRVAERGEELRIVGRLDGQRHQQSLRRLHQFETNGRAQCVADELERSRPIQFGRGNRPLDELKHAGIAVTVIVPFVIRRTTQDAVIGERPVQNVRRGNGRHVALRAVVEVRFPRAIRLWQRAAAVGMTLQAALAIELGLVGRGRDGMRIVARDAAHPSLTPLEANAAHHVLDLARRPPRTRHAGSVRFHKHDPVVVESFAGTEVVRGPPRSQNPTFAVQMTLGAHRLAAVNIEPAGVHDRIVGNVPRLLCRNMLSAGAVTSFAADGLFEKRRLTESVRLAAREVRQTRVTRQTTPRHAPLKSLVRFRQIVRRKHPLFVLRVPRDARLEHQTVAVDHIRPPALAGTESVVDGNRLVVDHLTEPIDHDFVMLHALGRSFGAIPAISRRSELRWSDVVFNRRCGRHLGKRLRHRMRLVFLPDIGVAVSTGGTADEIHDRRINRRDGTMGPGWLLDQRCLAQLIGAIRVVPPIDLPEHHADGSRQQGHCQTHNLPSSSGHESNPHISRRGLPPQPTLEQKETKGTKDHRHATSAIPSDSVGSRRPSFPSFASVQNLRVAQRNKTSVVQRDVATSRLAFQATTARTRVSSGDLGIAVRSRTDSIGGRRYTAGKPNSTGSNRTRRAARYCQRDQTRQLPKWTRKGI